MLTLMESKYECTRGIWNHTKMISLDTYEDSRVHVLLAGGVECNIFLYLLRQLDMYT
jgi:hypothetical protein